MSQIKHLSYYYWPEWIGPPTRCSLPYQHVQTLLTMLNYFWGCEEKKKNWKKKFRTSCGKTFCEKIIFKKKCCCHARKFQMEQFFMDCIILWFLFFQKCILRAHYQVESVLCKINKQSVSKKKKKKKKKTKHLLQGAFHTSKFWVCTLVQPHQ